MLMFYWCRIKITVFIIYIITIAYNLKKKSQINFTVVSEKLVIGNYFSIEITEITSLNNCDLNNRIL